MVHQLSICRPTHAVTRSITVQLEVSRVGAVHDESMEPGLRRSDPADLAREAANTVRPLPAISSVRRDHCPIAYIVESTVKLRNTDDEPAGRVHGDRRIIPRGAWLRVWTAHKLVSTDPRMCLEGSWSSGSKQNASRLESPSIPARNGCERRRSSDTCRCSGVSLGCVLFHSATRRRSRRACRRKRCQCGPALLCLRSRANS